MRKQELIHMNQLCAEVGKFIRENHDLDENWLQDVYDNAGIDGPHDFRAAKRDQKETLFGLIDEITTTINDETESDDEIESATNEQTSTLTV